MFHYFSWAPKKHLRYCVGHGGAQSRLELFTSPRGEPGVLSLKIRHVMTVFLFMFRWWCWGSDGNPHRCAILNSDHGSSRFLSILVFCSTTRYDLRRTSYPWRRHVQSVEVKALAGQPQSLCGWIFKRTILPMKRMKTDRLAVALG